MKLFTITLVYMLGMFLFFEDCRAEMETGEKPDHSLFAIPVAFYTTDTGFGYGAAGIYGYRSAPERESQVLFAVMHTTKHQFQVASKFEHYFPDGRQRIIGEAQYSLFPMDFFGLGNHTQNKDPETYTPEYTGEELTYDCKIYRDFSIRCGAFFRNHALVDRKEGSAMQSSAVHWGTGRMDAGVRSGFLWDSRDNTIASNRGMLLKLEYLASLYQNKGKSFNGLTLELRSFHQPRPGWISGTMFLAEGVRGDCPFYFLSTLGGQERLRGYEVERFIGRNSILVQQDLRFPIWRRIGGCAFIAAGRVADEANDLVSGEFHVSGGGGLRYFLKRESSLVLRADFAFGKESSGTYISFGEAF